MRLNGIFNSSVNSNYITRNTSMDANNSMPSIFGDKNANGKIDREDFDAKTLDDPDFVHIMAEIEGNDWNDQIIARLDNLLYNCTISDKNEKGKPYTDDNGDKIVRFIDKRTGNIMREETYDAGTQKYMRAYEYEYGDAGQITKKVEYSSDHEFSLALGYEYDDIGRCSRQNYLDENGKILRYNLNTYDEELSNTNPSKVEQYRADDSLFRYVVRVKTESGRIENRFFDGEGNEIPMAKWLDLSGGILR